MSRHLHIALGIVLHAAGTCGAIRVVANGARLRTSISRKARGEEPLIEYIPRWEEAGGGNAYEMCAHAAAAHRKRRRTARTVRSRTPVGVTAEICHIRIRTLARILMA